MECEKHSNHDVFEQIKRGEASYLCHFLEVFMSFLQSSGSVQRLAHARVFAEEGLAVVFDPVQNLCRETNIGTHLNWHVKTGSHKGAL